MCMFQLPGSQPLWATGLWSNPRKGFEKANPSTPTKGFASQKWGRLVPSDPTLLKTFT